MAYPRTMTPRKITSDDLSPYSRAWAAEIRAERNAQHLTQAELAKRARVAESVIKRAEGEKRDLSTDQLWAICRALGVSVTELSDRAERRIQAESRRGEGRRASG